MTNATSVTWDPQVTKAEEIASMFAAREHERYALHSQYMNEMTVRLLRTLGYDVGFRRGKGPYLFDSQGQRYLDLVSGWGVFGIGRNHPRLRAALTSVLASDLPNLVQMDVSALAGILAERLLRHVPFLQKALFTNSGAEAIEAAIKFARRATGRSRLVYCSRAFHGLTCGALSLTGERTFRDGFTPLLEYCVEIPFNDLDELQKVLSSRQVAAFVVEPIQGHGVNLPDPAYLPEAQRLCRKYGSLLVADEIQTGMGRTGRFLAVHHWDVEPDVVLIGKTLSGGHVPVAAMLTRKWIFDRVFDRMERAVVHGSTFGANDLAMAAGITTLEVIEEEGLIENAARAGARLMAAFRLMAERYEMIKAIRGKGLMIGVEFGAPRSLKMRAAWTLLESLNVGLFCQLITIPLFRDHKILVQVASHASHTVRLLPAFVISDDDCEWITESFAAVIADSHRVPGAVWSLGKTLVDAATKARTAAM
jgi:ornithine--oxo-acid transaminase